MSALSELAGLHQAQKKYADAVAFRARALAAGEREFGSELGSSALAGALARVYSLDRNYAAAEPLFKRVIAAWEKAAGPNHPAIALWLAETA